MNIVDEWLETLNYVEPSELSPTEFLELTNNALECDFPSVLVKGEVASFKENHGKWIFFDLKDEESSVSCFMPKRELRMPIEDGMQVIVQGRPKVTKWGKFSLTIKRVQPVGEGSLKKSFEMLKKRLVQEGLFDDARKRALPEDLTRIGVISSTGAAGYADFVKILNARWGGIKVLVAHTQVQGMDAPDQIIRALRYFNERDDVQVIAILRGGGSADDLSCFNDEELVREIARSKIPVITGIGHEVDESLCDLAADVRASTPSNAAEMLTRDRAHEAARVRSEMVRAGQVVTAKIDRYRAEVRDDVRQALREVTLEVDRYLMELREKVKRARREVESKFDAFEKALREKMRLLKVLNPEKVLRQGYAIVSGKISPGNEIDILTYKYKIKAEVKSYEKFE